MKDSYYLQEEREKHTHTHKARQVKDITTTKKQAEDWSLKK